MSSVIIDSCIWIATKRKRDQWHERAVPIVRAIVNNEIGSVVINDHIFNECVTFLIKKGDSTAAKELGDSLLKSKRVRIALVDNPMFLKGWEFSKRYNLSFTDGTILALMKNLGVKKVYSFDSGFDRIKWVERREDV